MTDTKPDGWSRANWILNALLVAAAALAVASLAWGLDTQDITVEWTPEGKALAMERAKQPAKDEMVRVPEHRVYLDTFPIDKYEVTAL